jgi:hypothetical protein
MTDQIQGQCMCGAVTITAQSDAQIVRACHCDMCRQWTSSMFMSVPTKPGTITVHGPVKTYRSSDWAERGFCAVCGSALWYMTVHDQVRNLAAGLFENAAGFPLTLEFFHDSKPVGYTFAGGHRRLSDAETIAMFTPSEKQEGLQ